MQIKTTQYVLDSLQHISSKKDYYLNFINLLINKKADKRPVFLYSGLLKEIFGYNFYTQIRNELKELNLIDFRYNYSESAYPYITYKLNFKVKDLIDFEITDKLLLKRINKTKEESFYKLPEYIKQMYYNIEELVLPEEVKMYISKSSTTGRIFHTVTSLSRKERENIFHSSGEQLVEIDVKNAQLLFLSEMFKEDINFNNDVFNGVFYENLANKMGIDISDDNKRKEFKRKFFNSILFNENKIIISSSKFAKAFMLLYPQMYSFLLSFDTDSTKANKLQNLESEFFILNLARDIISQRMWLVTIHDALLIKKKDLNKVIKMLDELSNLIFGREISFLIKKGAVSLCPTPYENSPLIITKKNNGEATEKRENTIILVKNTKGMGQNKNEIKKTKNIEKIRETIKKLENEGKKITIRAIAEKSGLDKKTVNKWYKSI
jgi:hypothetical protein